MKSLRPRALRAANDMPDIIFNSQHFELSRGETLLQCLLRHRQAIPHGCQAGVCQSCRLKLVTADGTIDIAAAQSGLSPSQRAENLFLSCQLQPRQSLEVALAHDGRDWQPATITECRQISNSVWQLSLATALRWQPGQYINLTLNGVDSRCYSATNLAGSGHLQLHIRRFPDGQVSDALCQRQPGSAVHIMGPVGEFLLRDDRPAKRLLLLGSGTGLAPLLAIAQHALLRLPDTPITLIHCARTPAELYDCDALQALQANSAITVQRAQWGEAAGDGNLPTLDTQLDELGPLGSDQCYLSGSSAFVQRYQRGLFMRGASRAQIFSEAFLDFSQQV
ncbi:FAD-binding oxidoreductase [Spongiibacter sp.]|uniref:FAD-binding oxidoreductase n=1 Tax=Spongiibacter sp. TaxID=2024860 RepID=UPI0035648115